MQEKARIAVFGVTGFIGRGLAGLLAENGFSVTGICRAGTGNVAGVDAWQSSAAPNLAGHAAVINLAGEPIASRWTAENKRRFHESRAGLTRRIVEGIAALPEKERPRVLLNASAVGIYGDRGDEELTEHSAPGGGYLADLCREWEDEAHKAEALGLRVICLRTGIVLGNDGDAFRKLATVFKCGIGGRLGDGRQWMPWIHVADQRAAILHALRSGFLTGPLNLCAPHPERNKDFTRKFAAAVRRPAIFPVPGFALKLALGGFGGALLEGQRALPEKLLGDGFRFRFPTLEEALADLVG
jgi:hypothetical protein